MTVLTMMSIIFSSSIMSNVIYFKGNQDHINNSYEHYSLDSKEVSDILSHLIIHPCHHLYLYHYSCVVTMVTYICV